MRRQTNHALSGGTLVDRVVFLAWFLGVFFFFIYPSNKTCDKAFVVLSKKKKLRGSSYMHLMV